jgi:hypothetical protein
VILLVKKGETNVHFAQTIQQEEPQDRIIHKVAAEIEGKLKHGEKIKGDGLSHKDESGVIFPRFGCHGPLVFFLWNAKCWMSLLWAKKFLGCQIHVSIEHCVKIGGDESLLIGAGDVLIVVKHVHRLDEHFEPIILQNNVSKVCSPTAAQSAAASFLTSKRPLMKNLVM